MSESPNLQFFRITTGIQSVQNTSDDSGPVIFFKPSWDLDWFWKKKQDQYQSSQRRIQTEIWPSRWIWIKLIKSVLVKKPIPIKRLKKKKNKKKKILKPMRMRMLCTIWKTVCQTSQTKIFKTWRFWNFLIKWPGDHSLN